MTVGTVDAYIVRQRAELEVLALRRASGVRCQGAWEAVHGRIEPDELPEQCAVREVAEETGLTVDRLYNVRCHAFYLHQLKRVNVAVVFAAMVSGDAPVRLGPEHDASDWLTLGQGADRFSWPRARDVLRDIAQLLRDGTAGPLEDVLRVR